MDLLNNLSIQIDKEIMMKEKKNINLFLSGKFVSLVGTYMYSFAMSLYILKHTGSGTSFALNLLLSVLPRVVLGPIAGVLADRTDRKRMVVAMDILSGLTVLTLLPLLHLYELKIIFIYANTFLLSIINTFFTITISASLPSMVRKESLIKINSYNQAAESISSIVSPVLGGIIYYIMPIDLFIGLNGVSFLLSAISEMFINFNFSKEPKEEKIKDKLDFKIILEDLKSGFAFLKEQKALFTLFKFSIILNFFLGPTMSVVLPYIINNTLDLSEIHYGLIEGGFPAGALATSLIISKLPEKDKKFSTIIFSMRSCGIIMLLMALPVIKNQKIFSDNVYASYYVLMMILFSIFIILINIPVMVLIQKLTPDHMMGRIMSLVQTIASGITPLGFIVMGALVDILPEYYPLIASGTVFIVLTFIMSRNMEMKKL